VKYDYALEDIKVMVDDKKNDIKKGRFAFMVKSALLFPSFLPWRSSVAVAIDLVFMDRLPKKKLVLYTNTEEERDEWIRQMRGLQEGFDRLFAFPPYFPSFLPPSSYLLTLAAFDIAIFLLLLFFLFLASLIALSSPPPSIGF